MLQRKLMLLYPISRPKQNLQNLQIIFLPACNLIENMNVFALSLAVDVVTNDASSVPLQ